MGGDVQSKATMRSILPITEAVQAALYFARYKESTLSEYCWSCDKMERELTDQDKDRVSPQLAAAARILADEVERLRKELNTNTNTQPL